MGRIQRLVFCGCLLAGLGLSEPVLAGTGAWPSEVGAGGPVAEMLRRGLGGADAQATATAGWGKAGRTQDGGNGNDRELKAE